jgi:hypothetical protein
MQTENDTSKPETELKQETGEGCPGVTCSSCRFWGEPGKLCQTGHTEDGIQLQYCQHPMVIQPTYGKRDNRKMRRDGVSTCDEGGCTGELITGPDFGCIHYQTNA